MKENSFSNIPPLDLIWILRKKAPALEPVLTFYKYIRNKGINVIFISERPPQSKENTKNNLEEVNYKGFLDLIVRDKSNTFEDVKIFKENQRKLITDIGHNIIMTVGDQDCDIDGKYTGVKVKIPNDLYEIE